jgi:hypothetical protein
MIPNHHQLLLLLTNAEPAFLAGSFDTRFSAVPEREGERGSFLYFEGGFWDIRIDGAARFLLTPWGSRVTQPKGREEDGPVMGNLPSRPPWSLVLPRHSMFVGREDDDMCGPSAWEGMRGAVTLTSKARSQAPSVDAEKASFSRIPALFTSASKENSLRIWRAKSSDLDLSVMSSCRISTPCVRRSSTDSSKPVL